MYDIFFLGHDDSCWTELKSRYPNAQKFNKSISIEDLQKKSLTKFFWIIRDDFVLNDFDLNSYAVTKWDDQYIHVFKNGEFYDGICLVGKSFKISNREFKHKFFANKKEIDITASRPKKYDIFYVKNYEEYLEAIEKSTTPMFWAVWDDVELLDFNFEYQVPTHNFFIVHVFKNGNNYDGVCLFPKEVTYSRREIEKRFFVEKKEVDIVVSVPILKKYDIVFISYYEPNADKNFQRLLEKESKVYRINGIKGIHQAHISAAELATTEMFYVVDGDAYIIDEFNFDYLAPRYERNHVHVWRSRNPINNLEYGYGGVKLLPREKTLNMKTDTADMTTSISNNFKLMDAVSNITTFNTDPFNTWKSAFRECAKLSSRVIARQESKETDERLGVWCQLNENIPYGYYAYLGALSGREYGEKHKGDAERIKKLNDFEWLKNKFDEQQKSQR